MEPKKNEKILAAVASLKYVQNGMVIGLGSGSTAEHMIRKLADEIAKGLTILAVPSSEKTENLAKELGIPLTSLDESGLLDINIDGADEFDGDLQLIKGGGGALLREKILAHNAKLNIIITDSSKEVNKLGKFKLPLETIPFATNSILAQLDEMGLKPVLRKPNGTTYRTDENNFVVDVDILQYDDLNELNSKLVQIPGIVETGLFLASTDIIIMGKGDKAIFFRNNRQKERKFK
ncbi:MAG: ribose-5-phosphate isomerase RpiA [Saonia sp.]